MLSHAGAGVLATLCGMAAGHLVASVLTPASSPVLAVGASVIDLTPTPLKEYAVREFGTHDKTILLTSVIAVTLLFAAAAGIVARRAPRAGSAMLLLLTVIAGVAALRRPFADPGFAVPSIIAAAVGVTGLVVLTHLLRGRPAGSESSAEETSSVSRRTVLLATGAAAGMAAVMGVVGQKVIDWRSRIGNVTLPPPKKPLSPLPAGLENLHEGISDFVTSNADFYRVDINLTLPVVPVDDWDLTIDGEVENSLTLSFDDLSAMPLIERDITLNCVSNEVGGPYIGSARWLGVRLTDLLDRARVRSGADQIFSTAEDGFTVSTPLEVVRDGRDSMVAIGMNGEPLPAEHGFPARLITPGLYGFVGATKWLRRLTLTTYAAESAYWTERGWVTDAPVKISSRIDTPKPLADLAGGRQVIGGVAWAQHRGIDRVEVRIDGRAWTQATLGPDVGIDYWRQWYLLWDAEPGQHKLAVRAVSGDGEVQTAVRATPFPEGSSGIQEIIVNVS